MPTTTSVAILASAFINTLGVNTHIDFKRYGYENLTQLEQDLIYVGVRNVRDSARNASTLTSWPRIASATGVKFMDFMATGSPQDMRECLPWVTPLARAGVLNYIEGGNEEEIAYAIGRGNNQYIAAEFQKQIYNTGRTLGIPVVNMSFGGGWTAANNWQGNYGSVGDLSAITDYANAHTYPNKGQKVDATMIRLNGLAKLAAGSRPIITTEIGWDENKGHVQDEIAKHVLNASFDGWKNGNVKTYFYALYDDGAGKFGLMGANGVPKPAGKALHNLTSLLDDDETATFTTTALTYELKGAVGGENSLVLQKTDGAYWLSVWDEKNASHVITVTLPEPAKEMELFNPLLGKTALQSIGNTKVMTVTLANSPVLVRIVPADPILNTKATPNVINSSANFSTITATAGTTAINAEGSGNTIVGGVGTYSIQAYAGRNTIQGGTGNATLRYGGTGNKIVLSSGTNVVYDVGTSDTIVFGKTGTGAAQINGNVLDQGDVLDFTGLMASTQWNRDGKTLQNFLKVSAVNGKTVIEVNPSGIDAGARYPVAVLNNYTNVTIDRLWANARF